MIKHIATAAINQELLQQQDIASLLHALMQSGSTLVDFQQVNLLVAEGNLTPNSASSSAPRSTPVTLYSLVHTPHTNIGEQSLKLVLPSDENTSIWLQSTPACYTQESLQKQYPEIALLKPYQQFSSCYHTPLTTQAKTQWQAALEFVKTSGAAFTEHELVILKMLAHFVSSALQKVEQINQQQQKIKQLHLEQNHLSILVHITNTALSTIKMSDMVSKVSKEIQHYFGVDYIGIDLLNPYKKPHLLKLYSLFSDDDELIYTEVSQPDLQDTLFLKALQTTSPLVIHKERFNEIAPHDFLHHPLERNPDLKAICLLPLSFGYQAQGVITLAHHNPAIFTQETVVLLGQIASRVAVAVHNALDYESVAEQKETLAQENLYLTEQIQAADSLGEIIGTSDAIKRVLEQVEMVAQSDSTVLVLGETGTGKELFARAIHNRSQRKDSRMVQMNCAAIPSGLLESELFGHERGAFTGATAQRKGRFELASGSTLLLDEVGDIPLELQPKLLRVLQEQEIERLGGNKIIPIDVRLIAATNRNLEQMVHDDTFRADLYYRLNVFPIVLPPLRERKEDIPLLAQFFTQKIAKKMQRKIDSIPTEALRQLHDHPWPGNIRELANVIERAVILTTGSTLNLQLNDATNQTKQHTQTTSQVTSHPYIPRGLPPIAPVPVKVLPDETEDERERILTALKESNGVVAGDRGAAIKLGVKRTTLLSRMQRLGITVEDALQEDGD